MYFDAEADKLTHSYVLAEFVTLAQTRGLPRAPALAFIDGLQTNPEVEIIWVDEMLTRVALTMLQKQLDKTYSLCDAVSFVLMNQRRLNGALSTDNHFAQAGFRPLLLAN